MKTRRYVDILKRVFTKKNYLKIKLLVFLAPVLSDKTFLRLMFPLRTGYKLNLETPKTLNEKLQWLKLYDRRPEYTQMVDKAEAKKYVANIIGEEHIIPTYAVYDTVDEIDFNVLPNQFVLKCTHDSGGIVICHDKKNLDRAMAIKTLRDGLKKNYYNIKREWPYKNVTPRIIAEKYMCDEDKVLEVEQLRDYKIFCFNGEPKFIEVDYDRYVNHKLNVYDLNWNFVDFYMTSPNDENVKIPRPQRLETMLEYARKLSAGIPFLRVDLYSVGDMIYFGELTFHPGSGMIDFHPQEYDLKLGDMLSLPIDN